MTITADDLRGMFQAASAKLAANVDTLNQLDAALGDGDHGTGISTGFAAAVEAIQDAETPAAVLKAAAMQLMNRMGGASGAVFGTLYFKAATALPDVAEITPQQFASMWGAGREGVIQRGKAQVGDKTMVDALSPAVDALVSNIDAAASLVDALRAAKDAAATGAESTADMQAQHGRAKFIGERAVGHMDAGAKSVTLIFEATLEYFEEKQNA